MKILADCFGQKVRLTDERLSHIMEHQEMQGMASALERALRQPQLVRRSRTDPAARLFYEFHAETPMGGKWLCIVVKYVENDAFVVTGYLTDKPKDGENICPAR